MSTAISSTSLFFFFAFPLSPNRPIRYLLRSALVSFSFVVRRGSGALSPATYAHPLSSLFLDDTTRISQHTTSMGGHPAWDLNPADLAVVSGECRSSFHHPTVSPYLTYTHIHGPAEFPSFEKILPLRWDSNPLAPGPRPRSTVSDSHAATKLPTRLYSSM
jgi:hypothetical protein